MSTLLCTKLIYVEKCQISAHGLREEIVFETVCYLNLITLK